MGFWEEQRNLVWRHAFIGNDDTLMVVQWRFSLALQHLLTLDENKKMPILFHMFFLFLSPTECVCAQIGVYVYDVSRQ